MNSRVTNICVRSETAHEQSTPPSVSPIFQTAAFDFRDLEHLEGMVSGNEPGFMYTRDSNPNHNVFSQTVADMESAEAGVAAASGQGAMAATVLAHASAGDHVIAAKVLYGGTSQIVKFIRERHGIETTLVDANNPDEFAAAVQPNTKLAIVESISNPLIEVTDIQAVADAIGDVPLLVDNTFCTPVLLRPLELGASCVFHSASKYLNGHGDVMSGVVVGQRELMERVNEYISVFGANANPFECWLAVRGMRTLALRMERVSTTAAVIAEFLASNEFVSRVNYPGLADHASHDLARRILPDGCSGMISFELASGGADAVNRFMQAVPTIPFSPTLADARTTISHPASTSHRPLSPEDRADLGVTDSLVRLSIGLEDTELIKQELSDALAAPVQAT